MTSASHSRVQPPERPQSREQELGELASLKETEVYQGVWELVNVLDVKSTELIIVFECAFLPENSSQSDENAVPRIFCHWLADKGISPFKTAEKTVMI